MKTDFIHRFAGIPIKESNLRYISDADCSTVVIFKDNDGQPKEMHFGSKLWWWIKWDIMPVQEVLKRTSRVITLPSLTLALPTLQPIMERNPSELNFYSSEYFKLGCPPAGRGLFFDHIQPQT